MFFELKSGLEFKKRNGVFLGSYQGNGSGKHSGEVSEGRKDPLYSYPLHLEILPGALLHSELEGISITMGRYLLVKAS